MTHVIACVAALLLSAGAHAQDQQTDGSGTTQERSAVPDLRGFGIFGAALRSVNGTTSGVGVSWFSQYVALRLAGGLDTVDIDVDEDGTELIELDGSGAFALGGVQGIIPTGTPMKPFVSVDVLYSRAEAGSILEQEVDLSFSFGSYFMPSDRFFIGFQFVGVTFPLWLKVEGNSLDTSGNALGLFNGIQFGFLF